MGGVGLALVAGCGLGPFQPQQSPTTARLGFLGPTSPQPYYAAITQGLYDLGYVEGRNLHIEYRYAEGNTERLPELAADLVRLNADIILAAGNPAIQSAKQATRAIPIVMAIANSDPVTAGLVANLARPGGNVTGIHLHTAELSAKRLELLKEAVPGISRVALLWNPDNNALDWRATQDAAQLMEVELDSVEVRGLADFERALASTSAIRQP